jgi:membrane-bound lytic murein transglycosylase B
MYLIRRTRPGNARQWQLISILLLILATVITIAACAIAKAADNNDVLHSFFEKLQQRLIADGFDAQRVHKLYSNNDVSFEARGVSAYFLHNEATLNYKKMTRKPWIREARSYMREHQEALDQAQKRYGVDPTVITAIILVETKFGRYLGKRSILNILSTMACLTEPAQRNYIWDQLPKERRFERDKYEQKADQKSAWAYKELKAFLTYTQQHDIDPVSVIGSYAGALGIAQFMPSSILAYGQDGDGNGRIDLFVDADAIFSIANYLKNFGWKPGIDRDTAYKAVYRYNNSSYYVDTILEISNLLKG